MVYNTSLADAAYKLADRWDKARNGDVKGFSSKDLEHFNSNQIGACLSMGSTTFPESKTVVFLETLESLPAFDANTIDAIQSAYAFDSTGSSEIRLRWYEVALKPESGGKYKESAAEWVSDKGRMKFCRVVFRCARHTYFVCANAYLG
jgi:leukotriene-A4 hydrolase